MALSFLTVAERGMGELTSRPWPPVGSRILSGRKIRGAGALGCGVGLPSQPWARPPRYFVRDLGILCLEAQSPSLGVQAVEVWMRLF